MAASKGLIASLGLIVLTMTLLGAPLMLTYHSVDTGCPFRAEMALCSTSVLEHWNHWQSAFVRILVATLLLIGAALISTPHLPPSRNRHIRLRPRVPRPTLYQELFSQGILHRKEPAFR